MCLYNASPVSWAGQYRKCYLVISEREPPVADPDTQRARRGRNEPRLLLAQLNTVLSASHEHVQVLLVQVAAPSILTHVF